MTPLRRFACLLCNVVPALLLLVSCRESDPPPAHYRDLGSDGTILLPAASAWCDPAVAKGQAEWFPYRKLDLSKPAEEEAGGGAEGDDNAEIAGEIKEFLADYNTAAAADDVDDWLGYFEEGQEEALRPLFETSREVAGKLGEVRKQLEAKIPDAGERIAAACDLLSGDASLEISVQSLKVISDEEATAEGAGGSRRFPVRFVVAEDKWFIKVPTSGESAFVTKAALDETGATFDRWRQALGGDQAAVENVLQEVEAAAKAAEAKRPELPSRSPTKTDEKGDPEEGADTGDEEPDDEGGGSGGG